MPKALAIAADGSLTWEKPKGKARAQYKGKQEMNQTETEYEAMWLIPMKLSGEIECYWFESFTLVLGPDCRYTPDFMVMRTDGLLEFHEVKGPYVQEDAWVKFKTAAGRYPFKFVFAQKKVMRDPTSWVIKEY